MIYQNSKKISLDLLIMNSVNMKMKEKGLTVNFQKFVKIYNSNSSSKGSRPFRFQIYPEKFENSNSI